MRIEDFQLFADIVRRRSGILLLPDKDYLVESRLMPLARKWNLEDLEALAAKVRSQRSEALLQEITEAMTTNESSFFRDRKPFDLLRDHVLPTLLARRSKKTLRIWSAAASSGQEAYSIAMMLAENRARYEGAQFEIIGTDLSTEMIEKARSGSYTQFEVQRGLPVAYLLKYFTRNEAKWDIVPAIRECVKFSECNLMGDIGAFGIFDIVLCRNVLMYFDPAVKCDLLAKLARSITPDGVLFLGGAETVMGLGSYFKPEEEHRGYYVLDSAYLAQAAR